MEGATDGTVAIDLDRQRSVADILRSSLGIYQRYPLLFLILALSVVAPFDLTVLAITGRGPLARIHGGILGLSLYEVLTFSLIGPLISSLHVHAVVLIGEGRRPRLTQVAVSGLRVLPVVAATEIVANLGIWLGTLALFVPGLLLALCWSVAAQAAAVEREGWLSALRSSRRLAADHWWHIYSLLFLVGCLALGVTFAARAIPAGGTSGVRSVAIGIAVRTVIWSFTALTSALLYFDLRARHEAPAASNVREYRHLRDLD